MIEILAGGEIQWEYIHGLFDQAIYGGRVDNPVDTDVLQSYLMQYFNSAIIGGAKGLKSRLASNINLPNSTELHVWDVFVLIRKKGFVFRIIKRFVRI
jgi:hypothetical protein